MKTSVASGNLRPLMTTRTMTGRSGMTRTILKENPGGGGTHPPLTPPPTLTRFTKCYASWIIKGNLIKKLTVCGFVVGNSNCGRQFKLAHKYSVGPRGVPMGGVWAEPINYISKCTSEWLSFYVRARSETARPEVSKVSDERGRVPEA
nr:MAG: ORF4 [Torque teno polar bear virus 6]